jgi:hypothetical protein
MERTVQNKLEDAEWRKDPTARSREDGDEREQRIGGAHTNATYHRHGIERRTG